MAALLWGFGGSSKSSHSTDGEKRHRDDRVWRVLMHSEEHNVTVEWRQNDMVCARKLLRDKIKDLNGGPLSVYAKPNTEDYMQLGNQTMLDYDFDVEPELQNMCAFFLQNVTEIEISRLQTHEKLDLSGLPFPPSALTSLTSLRLCSDDILHDAALELLVRPTLRELDLSNQKLTTPRVDDLICQRSLTRLANLRLRRNALNQLPPLAMANISMLVELDLSENQLVSLPPNLLQLYPFLETLNLESNRIAVPALDFRDCGLSTLLLVISTYALRFLCQSLCPSDRRPLKLCLNPSLHPSRA
jgi:hypothetical protein